MGWPPSFTLASKEGHPRTRMYTYASLYPCANDRCGCQDAHSERRRTCRIFRGTVLRQSALSACPPACRSSYPPADPTTNWLPDYGRTKALAPSRPTGAFSPRQCSVSIRLAHRSAMLFHWHEHMNGQRPPVCRHTDACTTPLSVVGCVDAEHHRTADQGLQGTHTRTH